MKGKKADKKKSGDTMLYPHNLGFSALDSINAKVNDALAEFDKEMDWLHELLFECKKTFAKPEIQLLPKTPSQKRGRKAKRPTKFSDSEDVFEPSSKRQSLRLDDGEEADVEENSLSSPPNRSYRTRATSRTTTTARPKRNTRTTKNVKIKTETTKEPVMSFTKQIESQMAENKTPVKENLIEPENEDTNLTPINKVNSVKMSTDKVCDMDTETPCKDPQFDYAQEMETPKGPQIDNAKETETPQSSNDKDMIVQETPEMIITSPSTPATVVKAALSDDNTPFTPNNTQTIQESPEKIVKDSSESQDKKPRNSVRKSLKHGKTLNSSSRLSSIKRLSVAALHAVETAAKKSMRQESESSDDLSQSKAQSPEEKPVRTRTRLRLKKGSQNTDSVSSVTSDKSATSSQGSVADLDNTSEDDKPQRSTRTKTRKPKTESESKTRTKTRNKHQSSQDQSSADLSDDEVMLISDCDSPKSKEHQRLSANTTEDDCAFTNDIKPVRASTRTKQKKNSSKVDSENEDSGICSKSQSETSIPRTRSKMRPPKSSTMSSDEQSEKDERFVKPENPPPRTRTKTKKRVLSDDEADMSISKKSCLDQTDMSDMSVGLPISNSTFMSGKQDETKQFTDEECASSSSDYDSPVCPKDKAIRPKPNIKTFQHNLSSKVVLSNKPGIVKSFIKRNSPVKKLTPKQAHEQRKRDLLEKERKEQERLQRRQVEMHQKIEEQRKKNDEKMKKVADAREQKAKRDQEIREKLMKKLEEKRHLTEKQKEEKAKEDQEKQHLRVKKLYEAEERRKREEDERQQKIQQQEEENRMLKEVMVRKKDFEEQERQKKVAEEKRKYEERVAAMAALDKERQEEREAREEEKAKEQQKIREEREKQMALEKATREKQALEQKKQKDQLLKERMEKIKELEKKRLAEEEKLRADLKERDEAVKQIINNHNTSLKNTKEEILRAAYTSAIAGLNTTQTYTSSKPHNPDSYDMTPAKSKTYKPSTFETYDISGLKSDDSTDDEDAPKKRIPPWASGPNLKAALINQHYHPPDLESMFDEISPPDLNELFVKKKARFNKRTSSAHWDSPIMRPGSVVLNW
ncbi:inner centromere protein-like [Mytilus edulis]|uniref:inner centromere protein-like n=1 Tax=Mytilus edulis TaxID=6550 RepID=UPI0039EF8CA3